MRGGKTLSRADRLLRSRKYSQVISLLESQVFLYRDNFTFYRLLGTACLHVGDFGGAHTYLTRAQQIKAGDTRVELGLATVLVRRREIPQALSLWLSVLDREPRNRRARRGLSLVRRTEDPAEFVTMAESGRLDRLLPSTGVYVPSWVPIVAVIVIVGSALVVAGPPLYRDIVARMQTQRDGVDVLSTADLPKNLTDYEGTFRYVYSDKEIADRVERVGELFNGFHDNLAHREANRLLLSNASAAVKERLRLIGSYFRTPTFVDFKDNFTFKEVAAEPWLYEGCFVRWSGQTSNISVTSDAITFTLLVGYEDERVLEGTIPVVVPFTADVQPGGVELIGQITYDKEELGLRATSIRRINAGSR